MEEKVLYNVTDSGIGVITLNSPETMNSITYELVDGIVWACKQARADEKVKVVVVTGSGKGFSSGGDIGLLYAMDTPAKAKDTYDRSTSAVTAFYEIEKPVIAALNGAVAGASTALLQACDLVIAADTARIAFSFANIAFCPDSGCSYFLVRKVGYHKAAEILFFAKSLKMEEALELGLINKIVPADQLMNETMKWAETLAAGPGMTLGLDKKLLREAEKSNYYQMAELEAMYQVLTWASDDFKEGCAAFIEKRKPNFKGR